MEPSVPSYVFLPSFLPWSVVCVTHKSSPNNNKLNSALLGHLLNSKIIFIVSECYDKGGLRARGRFDTTLPQGWRAKSDKSLLPSLENWLKFCFPNRLLLNIEARRLQKVCQNKDCNFIHALKLFTICLAKDVTANFYDCLRKVWFLYFPFSIP